MANYLKPRRGKKATAISQNLLLKKGEIFFEYPDTGTGTGAGKIKMGDGTTTYNNLPYFNAGLDEVNTQLSNINTALNNKSDKTHNHDDIYYTESEIDTKLSGKANSDHKQAYTSEECTDYLSDEITYGCTPAAVKKAVGLFDPKSHTHDERYYTSGQINEWMATKQDAATAITTSNIHAQTVNYADGANYVYWDGVRSKPSTFPPSDHNHDNICTNSAWFDGGDGVSMFNKQGIYAFSVNPGLMIQEGAPSNFSEYTTVIVFNKPEYKTAFYIDLYGNKAVWSSYHGRWSKIPGMELNGTTLTIDF